MFPLIVCPATCELCGSWLPQHENSCARNGVHPSQWRFEGIPSHIENSKNLMQSTSTTTKEDSDNFACQLSVQDNE